MGADIGGEGWQGKQARKRFELAKQHKKQQLRKKDIVREGGGGLKVERDTQIH